MQRALERAASRRCAGAPGSGGQTCCRCDLQLTACIQCSSPCIITGAAHHSTCCHINCSHICIRLHCRSVGSASTWSLERMAALAEECTVTFYAKLHVRSSLFCL